MAAEARQAAGEEGEEGRREVKTPDLTKSELKKVGVTYTDTKPTEGGLASRTCYRLICDQCGETWSPPLVFRGKSLPDDYWVCPNGCNKPQAGPADEEGDRQKTWREILEIRKLKAQPEAVGDQQQPSANDPMAINHERQRDLIESLKAQAAKPRFRFVSVGGKQADEEETE